jgi:hypothetical protein
VIARLQVLPQVQVEGGLAPSLALLDRELDAAEDFGPLLFAVFAWVFGST